MLPKVKESRRWWERGTDGQGEWADEGRPKGKPIRRDGFDQPLPKGRACQCVKVGVKKYAKQGGTAGVDALVPAKAEGNGHFLMPKSPKNLRRASRCQQKKSRTKST